MAHAADAAQGSASAGTVADWLDWTLSDGAVSCGGAAGFADRVAARLGRSPAEAARQARLTIAARIERHGSPPLWSGEIRVLTADGAIAGRRKVERNGGSCAAVVDTLGLMTELILNVASPAGRAPTPPAEPAPAAATPPPTAAAPTATVALVVVAPTAQAAAAPARTVVAVAIAPATPAAAISRRAPRAPGPSRWTLALEAGAAVAAGLLPDAGAGAGLAVYLERARGPRTYVSLTFWPEETAYVVGDHSQGAALGLALVGLGVCPIELRTRGPTFGACLGADVGLLRARGFGFMTSTTQNGWSLGVGADIDMRQQIVGGLYASLGLRLAIPFLRSVIVYQYPDARDQTLFQSAPVAGMGLLRLGYVFE